MKKKKKKKKIVTGIGLPLRGGQFIPGILSKDYKF